MCVSGCIELFCGFQSIYAIFEVILVHSFTSRLGLYVTLFLLQVKDLRKNYFIVYYFILLYISTLLLTTKTHFIAHTLTFFYWGMFSHYMGQVVTIKLDMKEFETCKTINETTKYNKYRISDLFLPTNIVVNKLYNSHVTTCPGLVFMENTLVQRTQFNFKISLWL